VRRGGDGGGPPAAEGFREVMGAGRAAGEFGADIARRAAALFLFDAYIGVITRWFGTPPAERFDLRADLRQALTVALYGISAGSRRPAAGGVLEAVAGGPGPGRASILKRSARPRVAPLPPGLRSVPAPGE